MKDPSVFIFASWTYWDLYDRILGEKDTSFYQEVGTFAIQRGFCSGTLCLIIFAEQ